MAVTNDGDVYTWGCGWGGRLGHGAGQEFVNPGQGVPKKVEGLCNVTDIAAGEVHALAVTGGGAVYSWGSNSSGQLGGGESRSTPSMVHGVSGVVAVATGCSHSFALGKDGTVMVSGCNRFGQLGLGDTDNRSVFTKVPSLCGVVDIDGGNRHTIAVTTRGEVFTWGEGWAIGHGESTSSCLVPAKVTGGELTGSTAVVVAVAACNTHSMALTVAGELLVWGSAKDEEDGEDIEDSGGEKHNGAVPTVVREAGVVKGIACGFKHFLATTQEGQLLGFGDNSSSQLGLGTVERWGRGYPVGFDDATEMAYIKTPTSIEGMCTVAGEGGEGKEGKE